jgi:hypothetical protein
MNSEEFLRAAMTCWIAALVGLAIGSALIFTTLAIVYRPRSLRKDPRLQKSQKQS